MKLFLLFLYIHTVLSECECKKYFIDGDTTTSCVDCQPTQNSNSKCYLNLITREGSSVPILQCSETKTTITNCENNANEGNYCVKCSNNLVFDETKKECVSCSAKFEGCEICGKERCYSCGKSSTGKQLYLSDDQKRCVDCSDKTNAKYCGVCDDGMYYEASQHQCVSCSSNCELCTSATDCFQCTNNTILTTVGTSRVCQVIEHCKEDKLKKDHCEECEDGYYLNKGRCVKCDNNCNKCFQPKIGSQRCVECSEGYTLSSGQCYETITHCEEGHPVLGCVKCKEGYYLSESLMCEKCDASCKTCFNQANHCLDCNPGYYLVKKDGYDMCIPKDNSCLYADKSGCLEGNTFLNDKSAPGYFMEPGKQTPTPCYETCKICEGYRNNCSACIYNHLLRVVNDNDGKWHFECQPINAEKDKCEQAEMGYCTRCFTKHFIQADPRTQEQTCTSCKKQCETCNSETSCLSCADGYYRLPNDTGLCKSSKMISDTCYHDKRGCYACKPGFYTTSKETIFEECLACPEGCYECQPIKTEDGTKQFKCFNCSRPDEYSFNERCHPCSEIKNCVQCSGNKCIKCKDGFTLEVGGMKCSQEDYSLVIPIAVVVVVVVIIVVIIVIVIIYFKRRSTVRSESESIKPFHVSSDLEMMLLGADNENFPLKTDKWELSFGISSTKAIIDKEYEETVQLANMSKKEYFFEFHDTPSHKYHLDIIPRNATLRPGNAVSVKFKLKILCTCAIKDEIGITAMEVEDQEKESAVFELHLESDLSMKLDYEELQLILPPIGEGAFGMVFRGTYRGREVAVKKMKSRHMTPEQEKEFNHEVSMMTQLRHNCVVELIGAVYTEGEISIVTEFASYGSLSKLWKKYTVQYNTKVKMLDDMAVAISYLHLNKILHRDIKGENLLVYSLNAQSPVCAKLTDFGTCRNISERALSVKELTAGIGTPAYMSPECLQNSTDYSYSTDVYSYGVTMYETFIERGMFDDDRFNQPWLIPQFVVEGGRLEKAKDMPDNYYELVTKCWSQDPVDRPTMDDVLSTIESWGEDIRYAFRQPNGEGQRVDSSSSFAGYDTESSKTGSKIEGSRSASKAFSKRSTKSKASSVASKKSKVSKVSSVQSKKSINSKQSKHTHQSELSEEE